MGLSSASAWIASWFRSRLENARRAQLASAADQQLRQQLENKRRQLSELTNDNRYLQETNRDLEHRLRMLEGDRDVLQSQVAMFAAWETKLLARLDAEAAIEARRKARASEPTVSQDEML